MQPCMDIKRRGFRLAVTGNHMSLEVTNEQTRCRDLAKCITIRIDEKQVVVPGHDSREMIANAFLVTPLRRKLEARDQESIMRYANNYLGYKESYLREAGR